MRYTHYIRRIIGEHGWQRIAFTAEHYKAAGFAWMPLGGLPLLEAHQLVNKWNTAQHRTAYVYGLE